MQLTLLASALALAGPAAAWLPTEVVQGRRLHARDLPTQNSKTIRGLDGVNLFEARQPTQGKSIFGRAPTPPQSGIRGVNLGSLFVFEPWIAENQWSSIGCSGQKSEFDCASALGQQTYQNNIQKHWDSWYSSQDFVTMKSYGLNTVRIPVGYWMDESIVDSSSEPFPKGGSEYLKKVCGWAADQGIYVIIDHHGAPGAQVASNADTGQNNPNPGFYTTENVQRGLQFLTWLTKEIHSDTTGCYRTVGTIEILNEPEQGSQYAANQQFMLQNFYGPAQQQIRQAEKDLGVASSDQLTLFYMNKAWGSGDPTSVLSTTDLTAYDDHDYVKWAGVAENKNAYAAKTCNDNRGGMAGPTITGEWSLTAPLTEANQWNSDWNPSQNTDFYKGWFAAQASLYNKNYGWIFWTWKTELNDPRWDYSLAVTQGYIPTDFSNIDNDAKAFCSKWAGSNPGGYNNGSPPSYGPPS